MGLGSGGFANCGLGATGGRLRLLLGSACVSALLLGSGVAPALAACAINDVGNSLGAGPFNNTTNSINCINIQNSTVNGGTGKVSNTSPGVITTTSPASQTGIKINNSTLTGAVINTGTITATVGSGNGIVVVSGASVAGGITNSGTITAKFNGIEDGVEGFTLTFSAGISNSGKIAATSSFLGAGISSAGVSTFTGGISNSGTITAQLGVTLANVSTFSGGIFNSGTIAGSALSLGLPIGISVDGTGHIAGAAPATFAGGITNIGVVAGGIGIEDFATFTGGISNQSTITSTANGIVVTSISAFTGAVTNSGAISVGNVGIFVGLTNFASNGVSTFAGTIANSGAITAKTGISIVDGTIQGQIVDTGNVLATGHGILIDSASRITSTGTAVTITAPTFTGGVSNAGAISTSGASGIGVGLTTTFTGGVVNSGAIQARTHAITVAAVSTFAGGISNSGSLAATNAVLLVSNVAVFGTNATGGITNSGTITGHTAEGIHVLGVATFNGGISNSGLIAPRTGISVSGITTFAGGIANAGTITALVDGIVVGSGVTFAAGSAIVNSGTITGGTAAIDVSLATSPVTINQTAGSIGGAIKLSTNADVLNVSGGTINGNIVGAGTRDTINFNLGAGNTFTYASNFTGVNQVNINSGTLILNGANSATNVTVAGGVLAGTGTIDPVAVTIQNGGTFAPGTPGSPGTSMSIVGTVTFQPGATYQVYLNPSAATSATVSGAVSLAGTVQANFAPGTYVSRSYDILHSGGLGGTTFSGVTTVPSNFNAALNYTSTDVLLNLTAGLGQATGLTVNQHDVATAINTFFNNGGALPPRFATVFGLSGGTLAGALNQLDGEAATGAQRAAFQIESEFLSLLLDPFVDGRGDAFAGAHGGMLGFAHDEQASLPASVALAYASVLKAPPRPPPVDQRWTAWGSVYGGQASANGDPVVIGSTNVTTGTFGFAGGMDYRLSPDTVVGFGLGGGGTDWGLAQGMGGGRSDTLQAGVYGATHRGPAYAAAAVAFDENWMSTSRSALGDALTANFAGQSVGVRLEGGYRYPLMLNTAALGIAPYAAVQTQWFHTPGYSERDLMPAGFGLTYQAMTANDTRSELGLRADNLAAFNGMPLLLRGRLAWAHDWVDNPALSAVFQTLPGANFAVFGAPVAHNTALAGAGAELRITPKLTLIGKFDGEFATGAQTYAGSGTLRYRW